MWKSVVRYKLQESCSCECVSISTFTFMSYLKAKVGPSSFWLSGLIPLYLTSWINILLGKH